MVQEGKANLAELEVLDFAEFSPHVWLTGKSWKVVPKVAEKLMVASSCREGDFPCFPEDLFLPGGLREKIARQVIPIKPSQSPLPKPSRWLPDDSSLTRLPQAWFHSRRSPTTSRFDKHVSLFLEFVSVLEDPRVGAKRVVDCFCLLFAFCCLTKAKSWAVPIDPQSSDESSGSSDTDELSDSANDDPGVEKPAVSMARVRSELAKRSGPLFSRGSDPKPVKLWNLLSILFDNPKVFDPSYRRNKSDLWVEALRRIRVAADSSPPNSDLKVLRDNGSLLSLVSKCWKDTLGFTSFWKCTAGSFAKSGGCTFPLDFEESSTVAVAEAFEDVWAGNAARLAEGTLDDLLAEARDKLLSLFKGTLSEHYSSNDKGFSKVLKACCRAGSSYSSATSSTQAKTVTFAVACFLRLVKAIPTFPSAAARCLKEVIKSFDKSVQHHKIKVNCLASHSPFFEPIPQGKKKAKLLLLPWDKVLEAIDDLSA